MEKVVVLWSMLVFSLSICSDASAMYDIDTVTHRSAAGAVEKELTELLRVSNDWDRVELYVNEIKNLNSKELVWDGDGVVEIKGDKVEFRDKAHNKAAPKRIGVVRGYLRQIRKETEELKSGLEKEARVCIQELEGLGGNSSILGELANGVGDQGEVSLSRTLVDRAHEEIARLRQEAEQRRQQEEARAKQEAEKRRQEEEARAKQEEKLNRQREEVRAQQAEEVRLRMQELEDLGGDTSILKEFENGSGDPEKIREYKAALNRADAEIVRLRKEGNLNNQSAIDQLTEELESQKEENQELRGMIEQLMKRIENLEMGKK